MQLISTTETTGSIVTPLQVLTYPEAPSLALLLVRINLQDIQGNGVYTITLKINGQLLVPVSSFTVPAGETDVFVISREVTLEADNSLSIFVTGLSGDTAVNVIVSLYSVTPLDSLSLSGGGTVLVNHDYPTADNMTLLDPAEMPIIGACIYIYSAEDFEANRLAPEFIVGRSITTTGGKWATPVVLDPGDYYAYFFKMGSMNPTNVGFTVT